MTPTARMIGLVALGAPAALIAALIWPDLWGAVPLWAALMLGLFTLDGIMAGGAGRPVLALDAPGSVGVGEAFTVRARLNWPGTAAQFPAGGAAALAVHERLVPEGRAEALVERSDGGSEARFILSAARRGPATIGPLWVRWAGRLGLAQRQRHFTDVETVGVVPSIRAVREDGVPLFTRDAQIGQRLTARIGEGSEFESLVRFFPGLDRRAIDWKQSARHGDLLAKQFETERDNRLVLVVDTGRMMCDPLSAHGGQTQTRLDCAVSAALSLAYVALRLEDRVSVASFAARPGPHSREYMRAGDFADLRRFAATVDYSADETNYIFGLASIGARLKRRALIVVFTEFADAANAALMLRAAERLVTKHLLLFVVLDDGELAQAERQVPVDAEALAVATIAADLARDRRLVLARLRRMGAQVVEARPEGLSGKLLETYIRIKRRGML
jgi:uncharacterized protein (DUF58 family)